MCENICRDFAVADWSERSAGQGSVTSSANFGFMVEKFFFLERKRVRGLEFSIRSPCGSTPKICLLRNIADHTGLENYRKAESHLAGGNRFWLFVVIGRLQRKLGIGTFFCFFSASKCRITLLSAVRLRWSYQPKKSIEGFVGGDWWKVVGKIRQLFS